jgi:GNAT superfamily N-acetyltransferase
MMAIASAGQTGQEQRVEFDKLGYYSKALEAAKALKQEKGTPEQMLAMLRKAGVKEAEIKATGLDKFIAGRIGSGEAPGALGNRAPITVPAAPEEFARAVRSQDIPVSDSIVLRWSAPRLWLDIIENGDVIGRTFVTVVDKKINVDPHGTDFILGPRVEEARRRQGIASAVYDAMEAFGRQRGMQLVPGAMLSKEAQALWDKRRKQSGDRTTSTKGRSRNLNQITRSEIVSYLERNRVEVRESVYAYGPDQDAIAEREYGRAWIRLTDHERQSVNELHRAEMTQPPKWASYSLDPSNPTYRETVIHLPPTPVDIAGWKIIRPDGHVRATYADEGSAQANLRAGERIEREAPQRLEGGFRQGHFSELNVIAHARTSLQKDSSGKPVFLIDELQSDWGQKLREGGVRDEGKIAELKAKINEIGDSTKLVRPADISVEEMRKAVSALEHFRSKDAMRAVGGYARELQVLDRLPPDFVNATLDVKRLQAELKTAEAATPGHPLVSTTDQWTTTALRRLVRQAVEAGADAIAIVPAQVQNTRPGIGNNYPDIRLGQMEVRRDATTLELLIWNDEEKAVGKIYADADGKISTVSAS